MPTENSCWLSTSFYVTAQGTLHAVLDHDTVAVTVTHCCNGRIPTPPYDPTADRMAKVNGSVSWNDWLVRITDESQVGAVCKEKIVVVASAQ